MTLVAVMVVVTVAVMVIVVIIVIAAAGAWLRPGDDYKGIRSLPRKCPVTPPSRTSQRCSEHRVHIVAVGADGGGKLAFGDADVEAVIRTQRRSASHRSPCVLKATPTITSDGRSCSTSNFTLGAIPG